MYHHCTGHPDVRHVGCGGAVSPGGHGHVQLPTGFGFPSEGKHAGKFVVDVVRWPCYEGFCMKCGASGCFIRDDQKPSRARLRPGWEKKKRASRKKATRKAGRSS